MSQLPAPSLITDLEVRQDDALQSLAELEARIVAALAQFGGVLPRSSKTARQNRNDLIHHMAGAEQPAVELKLHQPEVEPVADEDSAAA
jgi:hypothetical protein